MLVSFVAQLYHDTIIDEGMADVLVKYILVTMPVLQGMSYAGSLRPALSSFSSGDCGQCPAAGAEAGLHHRHPHDSRPVQQPPPLLPSSARAALPLPSPQASPITSIV